MKKRIYGLHKGLVALVALVGMSQMASAQVGVGTNTPDPSAQLQIESTNKGLLIPRVNSVSVINAPANGLMVYQTGDTAGFYYNKGTSASPIWKRVADAGSEGGVADGSITNAKVASDAAIAYSKLNLTGSIKGSDIEPGAISSSNLGIYSVSYGKIAPGAVSGMEILPSSISGMHIMPGAIQGINIAAGTITGINIALNSIESNHITDGSITSAKIMDGAITDSDVSLAASISYSKLNLIGSIKGADLEMNTVTPDKINGNTAVNGQVLTFSNTTGVGWATPSAGGFAKRYAVAENTSGAVIAVVLGGTDVPLPDNQFFSQGITVDGSNTAFTVLDAGVYKVSYTLNTTSALMVATRVLYNGSPLTGGTDGTMSTSKDHFSGTAIFNATAGSTVGLQFYGLLGAITLNGGCMMSIEKIDELTP